MEKGRKGWRIRHVTRAELPEQILRENIPLGMCKLFASTLCFKLRIARLAVVRHKSIGGMAVKGCHNTMLPLQSTSGASSTSRNVPIYIDLGAYNETAETAKV